MHKQRSRWYVPLTLCLLATSTIGLEAQARPAAAPADIRSVHQICGDGAKWLRLHVTSLSLADGDSVTLTGSAGGSYTLTGRNWAGKPFHTRSFEGSCVTVTPSLKSPSSSYSFGGYETGTQALAAATVTVAAVGDICGSNCDRTADVIEAMNPNALIMPGDLAYESGTLSEFNNNYDPYYGQFKNISYPSPGNHEYQTSGAAGYFDYWGARAGERGKGYYSFDVGDWHFVALNSNIARGAGSAQEQWLRTDLTANTKPCTAAYWHHPRFSRGSHGDDTSVTPLYQALYDHRADLLIVGHDHNYQRFAMARPNGTTDTVNGIRQLLIGTGGRGFYSFDSTPAAVVEASNANTFGVGKLTLTATTYRADFVPVAGSTYTDSVTGTCKKASGFDVSVSPGAVSVAPGGQGAATVSVSGSGAAVALSASGLPSGVTASFSPSSVTPPGTSTVTLTASASAAPGTYPVTLTATSGSVSRTATLSLTVQGQGSDIFADDFETNKGWTVNPGGTDTATLGVFERGDPEQTDSSGIKQLGTTPSGTNSLVTGRLAGSSAGAYDLDGGTTTVRSPAIALPAQAANLSFQYNLAHGSNSGTNDYLRVQVVDGSTVTTVFQQAGAASNVNGAWKAATASLSAFAGRTIQLQVTAADLGTASLLEAQVDDIKIAASTGGGGFSDNFESVTGWTANPSGTDTASSGLFERGDPEETTSTYSNQVKQLGTTASGTNCLSTGRLAGSAYGANDLDGGVTSIRSPAFTVPSAARLTFAYSIAHGDNSSTADYLRVRIVDGTTVTTVFERLGAAAEVAGAWQNANVDLSTYAGRSVQILVEAADASGGSLFEAQVDDIAVS